MNGLLTRVGGRPAMRVLIRTEDGRTYDLGYEIEGTDLVAYLFRLHRRWRTWLYVTRRRNEFKNA